MFYDPPVKANPDSTLDFAWGLLAAPFPDRRVDVHGF
jgi:hypothetical protein